MPLMSPEELAFVEQTHPDGLSSRDIIAIFQQRGIKLSEATFRRYVQLGLLPRSRRVGQKGKHRGSKGIYPVAAVRRINQIKALMDQGLTLEEIRDRFVGVVNRLEALGRVADETFDELAARIDQEQELTAVERDHLADELSGVEALMAELQARLARLGRRVVGSDLADLLGATPTDPVDGPPDHPTTPRNG